MRCRIFNRLRIKEKKDWNVDGKDVRYWIKEVLRRFREEGRKDLRYWRMKKKNFEKKKKLEKKIRGFWIIGRYRRSRKEEMKSWRRKISRLRGKGRSLKNNRKWKEEKNGMKRKEGMFFVVGDIIEKRSIDIEGEERVKENVMGEVINGKCLSEKFKKEIGGGIRCKERIEEMDMDGEEIEDKKKELRENMVDGVFIEEIKKSKVYIDGFMKWGLVKLVDGGIGWNEWIWENDVEKKIVLKSNWNKRMKGNGIGKISIDE